MKSVVNEVAERQRRATNLIIFGASESLIASIKERKKADVELFGEIVKDLKLSVPGVKVIRLGKSSNNRPRSLKIVLSSSSDLCIY